MDFVCRSQWLRVLGRGSAAAHLLGWWFETHGGEWMSVSCVCVVFSGSGVCFGLITRPEDSHRMWCV
jgi:hypothetical protein